MASWRRRLGALLIVMLTVGLVALVATSSALITANTRLRSEANDTARTQGPQGSVLAVQVEYTIPSGGDNWESTRVSGWGGSRCFNHDDVASGTASKFLEADLTAGTASGDAVVEVYTDDNCSTAPLDAKSLSFTVLGPTANPNLAQSCGIDVVLVLDETGSVSGYAQNVRNAAIAFANGIADTGSRLALVEFSTSGSVTIPLTTVTSSWVSGAFTTHLNTNYHPNGRTNWSAGLTAAGSVSGAELVVFITDGNPNEPGSTTDGDVHVMQLAYDVANTIKASGTHMFAVGVGAALGNENARVRLRAVSGDDVWTSGSLSDKDVTFVSDFANLETELHKAAEALCGRAIEVTKKVDENGDGTYGDTSAQQFTFNATVSVPGGSLKWLDPNDGPASSPSTKSKTVGANGVAHFYWLPSPGNASTSVAIDEVVPAGYELVSTTCPTAQSPRTVNAGETVKCETLNRRKGGRLVLAKKWVGTPKGSVDLLVDGAVRGTANNADGSTGTIFVPTPTGPTSVPIGEQFTAGSPADYSSTLICTGTTQTFPDYAAGTTVSLTVPDQANIACTITNTRKTGSLELTKVFVDAPQGALVHLRAVGVQTLEGDVGNGGSVGPQTVTTGTYTLSESGVGGLDLADYDQAVTCTGGTYDPSTKTVPVADGKSVKCTFTNTLKRGSLTVGKVIDLQGATVPTETFTICITGPSYPDSSCRTTTTSGPLPTWTNLLPGSYAVSENDPGSEWVVTGTGNVTVDPGGSATATVTNTLQVGTIRVVKDFVGQPGSPTVKLFVKKGADGSGGTAKTASGIADGQSIEQIVPVGAYQASEAGDSAHLDLYEPTYACTINGEPYEGKAGSGTAVNGLDVGSHDVIVCTFTNTSLPSSIMVDKQADPTTFDEGQQLVTYTVEVVNESAAHDVTIDLGGVIDSTFGNLATVGHDGITATTCDTLLEGVILPAGASTTCQFTVSRVWNATESPHLNTVTVNGTDEEGRKVTNTGDESVTVENVEPSLDVIKEVTGASSKLETGAPIEFSFRVVVGNTSAANEPVTITGLGDFVDEDGKVDGTGTPGSAITITGLTCDKGAFPFTLAGGASATCTFTATAGPAVATYVDVVVVTGVDDDKTTVEGRDDASVTITKESTPPPVVPAKVDLSVVKSATPQVTLGSDGKAVITYSALVRNNGPNMANNVTFADAAPTGVRFVAITKQPDFGSCTLGSALIECKLGQMGYGVQTLITWTGDVSITGTVANTAVVGGDAPGDVPANNRSTASTLVVAPLKPPTPPPTIKPKPKPKPKPKAVVVCKTISVKQMVVEASGKKQQLRALVTEKLGKKVKPVAGVRVRITGPGIYKTVTTNARGVALATIAPTRPGLIKLTITNKKACNTQRIGVIGVFEPPVTG